MSEHEQPRAEMKRYPLVMPKSLYDQIATVADETGATIVAVIKRYIEIGLQADGKTDKPSLTDIYDQFKNSQELIQQRLSVIEERLGITPPSQEDNPNL